MSFELVHVRISKGTGAKRPVMILCSNSHYFQTEVNEQSARGYITSVSRNSDTPLFVVLFVEELPHSAYAVKRGVWRDLELIKAPPLPEDLSTLNLYSGNRNAKSPYLVERW